ncbi:MAG: thermonuclease family protein [Acholeplasmataceae bacterium]|nr:thermonuclease family protein [Acholeplasmataceae bacterium]
MRKLIPMVLLILLLTGCSKDIFLPNLQGKTEEQAITELTELNLDYEVLYEFDLSIPHGEFIRYESGFATGKKVTSGETIKIYIADNGTTLPTLANKTRDEVITILDNLGIDYDFVYENNFAKNDYDFSRYMGYVAGDLLPHGTEVKVYITWNGSLLPDLTNLLKREIEAALEYDFISNYTFEYIENDEFQQDLFAGYKNLKTGDPAPESGIITVYLYLNSFTDDTETLFISKYLSGEGVNRAIEIYNPTDATIDLSNYHIALFMDGSYEVTHRIQLSGMLESKGTHVLVYRGSSQSLRDKANQESSLLLYDGNDVVQLRYKNNTYIDTIYDLGNMLFVMWNEMFIREEAVTHGVRTFNLSEWVAYVPSFITPFGEHPFEKPETFDMNLTYLNNAWGGTTVSGMVLVTVTGINDGDTASFSPGFEGTSRMRFLGVDTPETHPIVEPWGLEAKAFTTSYLSKPGTTIYVQSDPFLGATETYGRSLGYVWVDGEMLNYLLVKNGYSWNYLSSNTKLVYNNRYLYRWFQDAQKYAQDNQLGLHS